MEISLKQERTPLNSIYFSEQNMMLLQKAIRAEFLKKSGLKIDYQNPNDLYALMRSVFINNQQNGYDKIDQQIRHMNGIVINEALKQIQTGVSQFFSYVKDKDKPIIPPAIPENTSIYGMRIDNSANPTV